VAASLLALCSLWLLFDRDRQWRETDGSRPLELLRFGIPVAGAAVLAGPLANSLLPMMLSAWTGSAAVAFYGIALALQGLAGLPLGIFEQVLVPQWARLAATGSTDDLVRSYQHYASVCFACAAGLGIPLLANDRVVLSLLFGPDYATAGPAMQGAVLATLFAAWAGPNEAMLRALGLPRALFAARLTTAAAGTAAGVLLIPVHGLMGAVVAFALAVVVLNLMYGAALYRTRRIHPFTFRHALTMLAALAAVLGAVPGTNDSTVGWVIAHVLAVSIVVCNVDLRATFEAVRDLAGARR
jgi:O-antigen/teichoic acid export membrane protein